MDNNSLYNFNRTLTLGSSGADVKQLQTYLAGQGYKNADGTPLKADGVFGPQTKAAIMQFQKSNGLTSDGVVGPKTGQYLSAVQGTDKTIAGPDNTLGIDTSQLTAQQKELFGLTADFITDAMKKGFTINPDVEISESEALKFLKKAKKNVHPVYQEQIDNEIKDAVANSTLTAADYERAGLLDEATFKNTLEQNRESWAGAGLAFSGSRAAKEQEMLEMEQKNREYRDLLYKQSQKSLARQLERQVGAENMGAFKLPTIATRTPSLEGYKGEFTTGGKLNVGYRPGSYQFGAIPEAEKEAITTKQQELITQANKLKTAGRSYKELFNLK